MGSWTVKRALRIGPKLGLQRQTAYQVGWGFEGNAQRAAFNAIGLAAKYHETGDRSFARKASIRLARLALQK